MKCTYRRGIYIKYYSDSWAKYFRQYLTNYCRIMVIVGVYIVVDTQ